MRCPHTGMEASWSWRVQDESIGYKENDVWDVRVAVERSKKDCRSKRGDDWNIKGRARYVAGKGIRILWCVEWDSVHSGVTVLRTLDLENSICIFQFLAFVCYRRKPRILIVLQETNKMESRIRRCALCESEESDIFSLCRCESCHKVRIQYPPLE